MTQPPLATNLHAALQQRLALRAIRNINIRKQREKEKLNICKLHLYFYLFRAFKLSKTETCHFKGRLVCVARDHWVPPAS